MMNNNSQRIARPELGLPSLRAVQESALKGHKFSVGQNVYFTAGTMGRPGASGSYKIIRLLPSDGDDFQYRIKSAAEAFERVAKESQLDRER
jgi:hypothetical protein